KGGVDAKLGITPTLTADVTVNTDFAQVEADQQVINLTRFPFFFPEKRQFFLESSGLLDLGTPGRVQLFYSRRIGLDTSGAPVPILTGGRLYGRLGPWRIGVLDAQTGGADKANDAVVRVQHDLFDRSYIGAIGTLHAGCGGQGVQRAGGWDIIAKETGSVLRSADWQTAWFEWRVFGGDRQNGDHFEVNFQRLMDAPSGTFEIFRGVVIPPGRYWWSRHELQYFMSSGRPLSVGAFVNWGQFYGGHSTDLELTAAWRGGGHIIVSTDLTRTRADLPVGAFTAVLSASRLEYDFHVRTSLLAFVQYDNESERV